MAARIVTWLSKYLLHFRDLPRDLDGQSRADIRRKIKERYRRIY